MRQACCQQKGKIQDLLHQVQLLQFSQLTKFVTKLSYEARKASL